MVVGRDKMKEAHNDIRFLVGYLDIVTFRRFSIFSFVALCGLFLISSSVGVNLACLIIVPGWYVYHRRVFLCGGGGGVDPIPCVSTHRISDPRSGPAQLLPPHVKQRSYPHGVRPQIPDR